MDPYRVERLTYAMVKFSKAVDTHYLIPRKTDQIKRIVHEMEFELENQELEEREFWIDSRDCSVYLAHLDTASGGWHRT